jgi:hypothetical protein
MNEKEKDYRDAWIRAVTIAIKHQCPSDAQKYARLSARLVLKRCIPFTE